MSDQKDSSKISQTGGYNFERFVCGIVPGVVFIGPDRRIISASESAEKIIGLPSENLVGRTCRDVFDFEECRTDCLLDGGEGSCSFRNKANRELHVSPERAPVSLCFSEMILSDREGRTLGAVVILRENKEIRNLFHEFRSATRELELEKQRDRMILDNIADGVISVDRNLTVQGVSRGFEHLFSLKKEQIIGRKCSEVLKGELCEDGCPFEATLKDRVSLEDMTCLVNPEGRALRIQVSTELLLDNDGEIRGAIGILRNTPEECIQSIETHKDPAFVPIVCKSPVMQRVLELVEVIADSDSTVLIQGESGTGKELIAHAIHMKSQRREMPFVKVGCSALPDTLLESELFGHVKGAFTGAIRDRVGRFEIANGGTILLDEIGDTSPTLQMKLLRVLQEKEFEPVGSSVTKKVDVRIIAATNRSLAEDVQAGRFRRDLFFRLSVIPIVVPPLRDRREDIPLLVNHFIGQLNREAEETKCITHQALSVLMDYEWPGNIRELQNAVEFSYVSNPGNRIRSNEVVYFLKRVFNGHDHLGIQRPLSDRLSEKLRIMEALVEAGQNKTRASEILGISRTTLWRRMKEFGIQT